MIWSARRCGFLCPSSMHAPNVAATRIELWTPAWVGLGMLLSERQDIIRRRETKLITPAMLVSNAFMFWTSHSLIGPCSSVLAHIGLLSRLRGATPTPRRRRTPGTSDACDLSPTNSCADGRHSGAPSTAAWWWRESSTTRSTMVPMDEAHDAEEIACLTGGGVGPPCRSPLRRRGMEPSPKRWTHERVANATTDGFPHRPLPLTRPHSSSSWPSLSAPRRTPLRRLSSLYGVGQGTGDTTGRRAPPGPTPP